MFRRLFALVAFLAPLAALVGPGATPATAQEQRCFPETGQCISGSIRQYWERNGGLAVFGFPISGQVQEEIEGRTLQVQWFERDRLEIQPNGQVTAGRLGVEALQRRGEQWQNGTIYTPDQGCMITNPATGHQICGAFARYWDRNGGVTRFGLPITGERIETIEGRQLTVQYFERRRFELHNGQVLLGLLGRDLAPRPSPGPQLGGGGCAEVPEARSAAIEPSCGPIGTVFVALGGGFKPREWVGVYVTTPQQSVFGSGFQLRANDRGIVDTVPIDTTGLPNDASIDGVWAITFEGTESAHRAIAYFRVSR